MIGGVVKMLICGILVRLIVSVIRQNCSSKKRLFGKLVLACEDEPLNATKMLVNDCVVNELRY